jgi:hypothetical protein
MSKDIVVSVLGMTSYSSTVLQADGRTVTCSTVDYAGNDNIAFNSKVVSKICNPVYEIKINSITFGTFGYFMKNYIKFMNEYGHRKYSFAYAIGPSKFSTWYSNYLMGTDGTLLGETSSPTLTPSVGGILGLAYSPSNNYVSLYYNGSLVTKQSIPKLPDEYPGTDNYTKCVSVRGGYCDSSGSYTLNFGESSLVYSYTGFTPLAQCPDFIYKKQKDIKKY